jgi:hypothetical protein
LSFQDYFKLTSFYILCVNSNAAYQDRILKGDHYLSFV